MSLPLRAAGAPPQRGDWERHKRRIAQLYLEENKPLREVADIMRTEHDFTATPKMYKQRFHQWDFRKNLKAGEVKKFKGQTAAGQETHLPVVHGRKLGSKRLKSLVVKSNKSLSRSPEAIRSPVMAFPGVISAPDGVRLAENSLRAVVAYSKAQLSNSFWVLGNYNSDHFGTQAWWSGMSLAAYKIKEKRDLAANFQVLNKACDEYSVVVQRQDPLLVWYTYLTILQLSQIGDDLASSFTRLAMGLCSIHFGRSHPLTVLWASLRRMTMKDLRQSAVPIMDAQFGLFFEDAQPGEAFCPRYSINMFKALHDMGLLSPEMTQQKLNHVLQWTQQNPGPDIEAAAIRLNNIRLFIVCILADYKEYYEQADALLSQMEHWMEHSGVAPDMFRVNCTEVRGEVDDKMGKTESAEFHFRKALAMAQELLWDTNPARIGFSFTALENFYTGKGDMEAAQAVQRDYNLHLKSMVGEVDSSSPLSIKDTKVEEVEDSEAEDDDNLD